MMPSGFTSTSRAEMGDWRISCAFSLKGSKESPWKLLDQSTLLPVESRGTAVGVGGMGSSARPVV